MDGDLLARFGEAERARGLAGDTVRSRLRMLERWVEHLDDRGTRWGAATYDDVETFVSDLGLQPGGTNRAIGDVARFYWWARRAELTRCNPTELVDRQRTPRGLPRPASGEQVRRGLAGGRVEDRRAVALMAYAGLRCLEVSRARARDIDYEDGWLRVAAGKGGHARNQPVVADLAPWLAELADVAPATPVYVGHRGGPATPKRVSQAVNRHLLQQGARITAHQLRHYYATTLYDQTGDLVVVQEALGHASVATTQVYTKLRPRRLREAVDSVVWR